MSDDPNLNRKRPGLLTTVIPYKRYKTDNGISTNIIFYNDDDDEDYNDDENDEEDEIPEDEKELVIIDKEITNLRDLIELGKLYDKTKNRQFDEDDLKQFLQQLELRFSCNQMKQLQLLMQQLLLY